MRPLPKLLLTLVILPLYSSLAFQCKTIPGDAAWPPDAVWAAFNASVDGRLVKSVPLATPCHNPNFDAAQCAIVQNNWHLTAFHEPSSSSVMAPTFSNRSCDPFNGANSSCILGTYVVYAVNASTTAHISKTVLFAKAHNIRFVVRNTGHDYMGKSTGNGALAIWTHYLSQIEWISSYHSPEYTGPAVKAQSGVTGVHLYQQASERGFTIVGGACPDVGLTGGFLQGGGHSPLSSIHGMAADNALAFEVVTTNGVFVTANSTSNTDLFWALRGGVIKGPGTYGIVWSVTMKAHPDLPFTTAVVLFSTSNAVTFDSWVQGTEAYRSIIPSVATAGGYSITLYSQGHFQLSPAIIPNKTVAEVTSIMQPFFDKLHSLGIPFTSTIKSHPGFLQAYTDSFNGTVFRTQNGQYGGRIIPKSIWSTAGGLEAYNSALRDILADGGGLLDLTLAPTAQAGGNPTNAVFPPLRTAFVVQLIFIAWDDLGSAAEAQAQREKITTVYTPPIIAITPGAGAYLNEADPFDPDWKDNFYGVHQQNHMTFFVSLNLLCFFDSFFNNFIILWVLNNL